MNVTDITPANSELVVTTIKNLPDPILEKVLGISSFRKRELAISLAKFQSELYPLGTSDETADQGQIFEIISRICQTPNELFWFAYRMGAFAHEKGGMDIPDMEAHN